MILVSSSSNFEPQPPFALKQTLGDVYIYDFTNNNSQSYGGGLAVKEIATDIWGMISGDGDRNGQIDNRDKDDVWNLQQGL